MSRPRNEDRRNAILGAATRAIASQGLTAATATIAKNAGVSNGSLFVYFNSKATLLNELYVELNTEMGAAAVAGLSCESDPREQLRRMWSQWLRWATANPEKRRALAQLQVSDEITVAARRGVADAQTGMAELLERIRADGPMEEAPLTFVLTLTSALADVAMDAMIREPAKAEAHSRVAFDAMWRVLAGTAAPASI